MRATFWVVAGIAALLWSLLAWLLFLAAGTGGNGVLAFANWIQIDPLSVHWLAELLDAVGSVAQAVVAIIWAIGMGALSLVSWITSKAANHAEIAIRHARINAGDPAAGHSPAVEGQVRARTIIDPPSGT